MKSKSKVTLIIGVLMLTSNAIASDNINELLDFDKAPLSCQDGDLNITVIGENKIPTQWTVASQCGVVHCKDNSTFTINDKTISIKKLRKVIDYNYKNFVVNEYERQDKNHSIIPTIDLSAMKATIEKAVVFEEGKIAFLSGKDRAFNPYLKTDSENDWLEGWVNESECDSDVSQIRK